VKFKVGEKVGFSENCITCVSNGEWSNEPSRLVNRGWAIVVSGKMSNSNEYFVYKLEGAPHGWAEYELEKLKPKYKLPSDLFEI